MPTTDASPDYGDLRLAPSLVRPGRVELHLYDVMPGPMRGGWIYVDEFATEAEALARAGEIDPDARVFRMNL